MRRTLQLLVILGALGGTACGGTCTGLSVQPARQRHAARRAHHHRHRVRAPRRAGRALFGQLVPWDSVWHPGADSATRISFDHPVLLEGREVKAGEYSVWLVPHASGPWTVILSRAAHTFHKPYPGAAQDAYRFDVTPERGAHMESLAYYFPSVVRDQAVLRIHWGETIVPIRISAPYQPSGG